MDLGDLTAFAVIGLLAGGVGGLLGIGGSTVFIPLATLMFGPDQQVYQAAAMILNAAVAASATFKHASKKVLEARIVVPMAVAATVTVLFGVHLGNEIGATALARLFGVLLLVLAATETRNLIRRRFAAANAGNEGEETSRRRVPVAGLASIGAAMGLLGGLLGVGGGTIGVPLLRFAARVPLRISIASAASVTLPLALVGAVYKNLSLASLPGESADGTRHALLIAAAVVPTAIGGAYLGAGMVHRLPITAIRLAFIGLLLVAGIRMLSLPG